MIIPVIAFTVKQHRITTPSPGYRTHFYISDQNEKVLPRGAGVYYENNDGKVQSSNLPELGGRTVYLRGIFRGGDLATVQNYGTFGVCDPTILRDLIWKTVIHRLTNTLASITDFRGFYA